MGRKASRGLPFLLFIFAFSAVLSSCVGTRHIDGDFDGVYQSIFPEGIPGRRAKVLIMHGFGEHCIGHADNTIRILVENLGLKAAPAQSSHAPPSLNRDEIVSRLRDIANRCASVSGTEPAYDIITAQNDFCRLPGTECTVITSPASSGDGQRFTYGYLRLLKYEGPEGNGQVTFYELTWDPATRLAKFNFLGYDWAAERDAQRAYYNQKLKTWLLSTSFSDPVLYLGNFKPYVQVPLIAALCATAMTSGATERACDVSKIPLRPEDLLDILDNTELVIITESLGSYLVLDAIRRLTGAPGFRSEDVKYQQALEELDWQQSRLILEELAILGPEDFQAVAAAREKEAAAKVKYDRLTSGTVRTSLLEIEQSRVGLENARSEREAAERKIAEAKTKIGAALAITYRVTRKIFLLANQVPLIGLSLVTGPLDLMQNRCANPSDRTIEEYREKSKPFSEKVKDAINEYLVNEYVYKDTNIPLKERGDTLFRVNNRFEDWFRNPSIIAISDPNDLLSYPIPICLGPNGLFGHPVFNVTTNIEKVIQIPGIIVWPVTAHTGHLDDPFVRELLVCGGLKGSPGQAARCR